MCVNVCMCRSVLLWDGGRGPTENETPAGSTVAAASVCSLWRNGSDGPCVSPSSFSPQGEHAVSQGATCQLGIYVFEVVCEALAHSRPLTYIRTSSSTTGAVPRTRLAPGLVW